MAIVMFGKKVHGWTYVALVMIAVGITMASVSQVEIEWVGWGAALLATLTGVLHNAFMKKAIALHPEEPILNLHFHSTLTSTLMIMPVLLFSDLKVVSIGENNERFEDLFEKVPFGLLVCSVVAQYLQTLMSTLVLSRISMVSHQVANTLKRLIVIAVSMWFFKSDVCISNILGIGLALFGFLMYGIIIGNSEKLNKENVSWRDLVTLALEAFGLRKSMDRDIIAFEDVEHGKPVESWIHSKERDSQ